MGQVFSTLLCLMLVAASCKKMNTTFLIPDGTYIGTFQRQTSTGGDISNVTITFSANNWSGRSEFEKYPALCHGTYQAKGVDSVTFHNDCPWTTEFDWSLILAQDYKIKVVGSYIEITRDYNGAFKDIYKLTKQ